MRQRGPKAQALLQMIAGPGDSERNLLTWEIPTYWNRKKQGCWHPKKRCRHGIFFANYERWWPRPSEMFFNTRLLYMMTSIHPYMRAYRYIYHTPNNYTNKMNPNEPT